MLLHLRVVKLLPGHSVAGPGTATITNANQIPASVLVDAFGAYTFTLQFSSGSCVPQSTNVVINFYDVATSTPEPDKTVCVDGNVLPGPIAPFAITGTVGLEHLVVAGKLRLVPERLHLPMQLWGPRYQ